WLRSFEDSINVRGTTLELVEELHAIRHQAAQLSIASVGENRGHALLHGKLRDSRAPGGQDQAVGRHQQPLRLPLVRVGERRLDLLGRAYLESEELDPQL